ncbi:MAG TPA: COX15/CtaA family protein [Gaiellaceae bacterium]
MHAGSASAALPRRFARTVSPVVFRRVALAAVGVLVIIVASGATVRLTGSGLGCPEWPTCTTQHALPQSYHSYIEFSNRLISAVTVFTTLALVAAAWCTRGLGRRGRWLATAVFVGTLAQAPLGAITVYYDLNPYLVITHLLLSFTLVSLAVLTLLEASRLVRGEAAPLPGIARLGGLVLAGAVFVLAVSGTVATAAGRFPGSSGTQVVPRLGTFYPAVYWHVRAVAVFGVVFLVLAAWAWARRSTYPWLLRGCAGLLAILAAQMAIGEVQYRTYGDVPWWLVLLHVATAATLVGWTVGLAARLWRPIGTADTLQLN